MNWREDWKGIRARVAALGALGPWFPSAAVGNLRTNAESSVTGETVRIKTTIDGYFQKHKGSLPAGSADLWQGAVGFYGRGGMTFDGVNAIARIVCLTGFVAEFDALVASPQPKWSSLTARALQHLNRLLVVDGPTKTAWGAAFAAGETELERLGAIHMLHHGLFAVKVNAAGARTDLVVPERPSSEMDEDAVAANTPFVLTEWKRVRNATECDKAVTDATTQLTLYGDGSLADFTLRESRYMVLVSNGERFGPGPRVTDQGWTLRCLNVVIDPPSPSKASLAP